MAIETTPVELVAPGQETMVEGKEGDHWAQADLNNVKPCLGGGCCMYSCYQGSDCYGCMGNGECLCLNGSFEYCKLIPGGKEVDGDTVYCTCCKCAYAVKKPETCCGVAEQCCCIDFRAAFPCNDEHPCIVTGLPCCVMCGGGKVLCACCKTLGEMGIAKPAEKEEEA